MAAANDKKQKPKPILDAKWIKDMEHWEDTVKLEQEEKLSDGSIIRWCIAERIPGIYYLINSKAAFISRKLVQSNKDAIMRNKRGK